MYESRLEEKIARIWAPLLGMGNVDPEASFFDLGGDSLRALQMAASLERSLGQTVSPSLILQASTVRQLARVLQEEQETGQSIVIPIQPLGGGVPLFLFHPAHGELLVYSNLVRLLGTSRPIFGLRRERDTGDSPRFTRVEDLGASYARAIVETWPRGPYFLGGHSLGAILAFEAACQLTEAGAEVPAVFLIDPRWPSVRSRDRAHDPRGLMVNMRNFAAYYCAVLKMLDRKEAVPYFWNRLKRFVTHQQAIASAVTVHRVDPYSPRRFPGRAILIRARFQPEKYATDRTSGFSDLVPGTLQVHEIPSVHKRILDEPMVRILARLISEELNRTA